MARKRKESARAHPSTEAQGNARRKTSRGVLPKEPTPMERAIALVAWVRKNIPVAYRCGSGPTPLAQCLWYAAYQEAETLVEETTKHLAQALQDGMGPYKTIKHLASWLEGILDCESLDDIHAGMKEFWGKNA